MRRVLFALIVAVLVVDAAGLECLLVPERCAIADQAQDNDCPATCSRCACAQPVVAAPMVDTIAAVTPLAPIADSFASPLLPGSLKDVLHVPKAASLLN